MCTMTRTSTHAQSTIKISLDPSNSAHAAVPRLISKTATAADTLSSAGPWRVRVLGQTGRESPIACSQQRLHREQSADQTSCERRLPACCLYAQTGGSSVDCMNPGSDVCAQTAICWLEFLCAPKMHYQTILSIDTSRYGDCDDQQSTTRS
jgi:hypothetical protein